MSLNNISQPPSKNYETSTNKKLLRNTLTKKWKILLSHSCKFHTGHRESFPMKLRQKPIRIMQCNSVGCGPDVVICCLPSSHWVMWDTAKITRVATSLASSESHLFFGKSEKCDNGTLLRLLGTEILHMSDNTKMYTCRNNMHLPFTGSYILYLSFPCILGILFLALFLFMTMFPLFFLFFPFFLSGS